MPAGAGVYFTGRADTRASYFNGVISAAPAKFARGVGAHFYHAAPQAKSSLEKLIGIVRRIVLVQRANIDPATVYVNRMYIKRIRGYSNRRYLCFARRPAFRSVYNHVSTRRR